MASLEDEIQSLKEKNVELVQKVQQLKFDLKQKDATNLELLREVNYLKLNNIRLKTSNATRARTLDAALQSSSEDTLTHLVQASNAVTKGVEAIKTFLKEVQSIEIESQKSVNLNTSPRKAVRRVPPLLMDGQSIQPFVSLSRNFNSDANPQNSLLNRSRERTVQPLPMYLLRDLYIPLQRIDSDVQNDENSMDDDEPPISEDGNDDNTDNMQDVSDDDAANVSILAVLDEMSEPDNELSIPDLRTNADDSLEGPSLLLDNPPAPVLRPEVRLNFEPDSTTETDVLLQSSPGHTPSESQGPLESRMFTPTVRRRKRTSSPIAMLHSPEHLIQRNSNRLSRILKVIVPKLELSRYEGVSGLTDGVAGCSPPKRPMVFDAPSPNGATDSALRVMVNRKTSDLDTSSSSLASSSRQSDQEGGRPRRTRRQIIYKEKPVNRKMRR